MSSAVQKQVERTLEPDNVNDQRMAVWLCRFKTDRVCANRPGTTLMQICFAHCLLLPAPIAPFTG